MKVNYLIIVPAIILNLMSCGTNATSSNEEKILEVEKTESTISLPIKTKVSIFSDIEKTRNNLSENGIGDLSEWKSDMMGGFMSITSYYSISDDLPSNTLSYYLESEDESFIQVAKLSLSIANKNKEQESFIKFKEVVLSTFEKLSLELPEGLIESIDKKKVFESVNSNFSVSLNFEKGNKIDNWTLKIQTK